MQISIINDCFDENARLRQISRAGALFPQAGVNCFAVTSELEAAGYLVDALDAFEGRAGIILVNVAPRSGEAKKWKNGTPFGYFRFRDTLVVSSVDGLVLSLAKKLGLIDRFQLLDIETVLGSISDEELSPAAKLRTINTQFRSFNFLPRAADWIWRGYQLPQEPYALDEIKDAPDAAWLVDNFGNIKTTLLGGNYCFQNGDDVEVFVNGKKWRLEYFSRLKDLPDQVVGIVEGSSGIGDQRFLEIIFQGGNAAEKLGLKAGDRVEI